MTETKHHFDLLILGAGPGGYVAAIRAAQLGLSVACVDEFAQLGGTCLRVGCIPSKALLESSERYESTRKDLKEHGVNVDSDSVTLDLEKMLARKDKVVKALTGGVDSLFKKNKITKLTGRATLKPDKSVAVAGASEGTYTADSILIATGSKPSTLPGVDLSSDRIDTSTDALAYDEAPKHLAVIGAGYIGLELGSVWRRLGSKVTVIEYMDRALPLMDETLSAEAQKVFKKQGIEFKFGAKVTGVKKANQHTVAVEIEGDDPVKVDRVLVAVGRTPNTDNLGLEDLGVERTDRGHITVDKSFKTSVDGVYAIGDCIPGAALAHKAEEEGVAFAEMLVTGHGHVDYNAIPAVVYTHPELASVGRNEQELRDEGVEYNKGTFPFLANGRARALGDTGGQVKVLADRKTDRVLGVHIIGPRAGDLIAECATAVAFGASSEDIARACHAHPTLSECVKEASLAVLGRTIHM
ncbi:MAG: dihydrolipoyl dehydrogenase [Phycisphaeraceae bacterium]